MMRPWFHYSNQGVTREVFLIGDYAFKIPKLRYGWGNFLQGLLCNRQECLWWISIPAWPFCPIVFSIPGGWLVVMRRARVLTDGEYDRLFGECGPERRKYDEIEFVIPVEHKSSSFGWIDEQIVIIDYGS